MHPALASLALALAGVGALGAASDGFAALTTESARRLTAARDRPAMLRVTLETMDGTPEALPAPGQATVVEFIYTTCPEICQVAGSEMAQLRDRIAAAPLAGRVRLISLSFDPERDTPEQMARYGGWHGAGGWHWTVARPAPDDLPGLLAAYGVTVIPDRMGGYAHNTALHVVDRAGRLVAILDTDDLAGAEAALARALK
ncbi:MAG: SCO family protein [Alphaproteobacteria bacterium HGW-Alphaproteobacteria-1]|jgi:protein SCO1/2|nr:MAG: SCO family protein [Alphaproteobacteria bacterium HGW-Alphaproteobacteria-1]